MTWWWLCDNLGIAQWISPQPVALHFTCSFALDVFYTSGHDRIPLCKAEDWTEFLNKELGHSCFYFCLFVTWCRNTGPLKDEMMIQLYILHFFILSRHMRYSTIVSDVIFCQVSISEELCVLTVVCGHYPSTAFCLSCKAETLCQSMVSPHALLPRLLEVTILLSVVMNLLILDCSN